MANLSPLQAGAGRAELRFPDGYFPSDGFSGVHDPMSARALLLEQGGLRGGIVTLELPSIRPWALTDELRAFAAKRMNAPFEQVWLVMTHDLSAPHVPREPEKAALHMDILRSAVAEAVDQALAALRPVRVRYSEGRSLVNANRDVESVDGWWAGITDKGPSDKTLSLIRFDDRNDRPVALLYSYALKSSVMEKAEMSDGRRWATGDVTGCAARVAEAELGCPVIFVMGAAGDQVPRVKGNCLVLDEAGRFREVQLHEAGWDALDELSQELARDILAASKQTGAPDDAPKLAFRTDSVLLPAKQTPPLQQLNPPLLHYDYVPSGEEALDLFSIRIGDAAILGLKAEVTTPIFDRVKAATPFPHTLMATLVNGGQGYIATDIDYVRFTQPALSTPFMPGADDHLVDLTLSALESLARAEADHR